MSTAQSSGAANEGYRAYLRRRDAVRGERAYYGGLVVVLVVVLVPLERCTLDSNAQSELALSPKAATRASTSTKVLVENPPARPSRRPISNFLGK